jgi:putative spermidine/putrescine transport system permease protein
MPDSPVRLSEHITRWSGLIVLGVFIVCPMVWVVVYSLLYSLGEIGLFSDGWTLRHWWSAFMVGGLKESLFLSPVIAATVTLLAVVGSLALVLYAPQARHSGLVLAVLALPLATPSAVMAVIAYQILSPGGFLARLAFHVRIIESPSQFPPMVNDPWAIGMIMAQWCSAMPLLTLFFLKTWTTARADRYCRLAESLGAGRAEARWRIALPMLLRRGRPLILLTFLLNLGSYEIPLLLGRQSPQMFSVLAQRRFGQYNLLERPEAFVLATTYLLLVGVGVQLMLVWRNSHA